MATRDYVKRGKRPRKTVQRRRTPSENQLFFQRNVLIFLGLLALGFIIYFLYSSFNQEAYEPNYIETNKTQIPSQSKPKGNEQELPPKVTEKWSYFETLENKKVEVEANEQEVSDRPYLLQCGAYRGEDYAEIRKANIAFQGLESQIKTSEVQGETWYRVVLGPYDLKRKAESDRNLLRRAGIEPCKIWFWEEE